MFEFLVGEVFEFLSKKNWDAICRKMASQSG